MEERYSTQIRPMILYSMFTAIVSALICFRLISFVVTWYDADSLQMYTNCLVLNSRVENVIMTGENGLEAFVSWIGEVCDGRNA